MRRYVKPAARKCADASAKIASQVMVAVVTALLVTFITNSLLASRGEDAAFAPAGMAAFGDASGARPGAPLPPLDAVVIEDLPISPDPNAQPNSMAPAGLYYAGTEQFTDPLQLLVQSGT